MPKSKTKKCKYYRKKSKIRRKSNKRRTYRRRNKSIKNNEMSHKDKVSRISIVGAGMFSTPGVTYKMFRGLAEENINILAISISEIKLSVIINKIDTLKVVKK